VFDGWVPVNESLIEWLRRPSNRVREKAEAWEEYKKRFPAIGGRKIFVAIDEWAYIGTQSDLKLALSHGMVMQEMFRHTDFIKMSAFTQGVATLDYSETDAIYNTIGLMFELYREHFGTIPVEVTGNSPQPAPNWPVGGDQPRVNAGGSTYPLDVVAALSEDRRFLTIAVINPTQSAQQIELKIRGIQLGGKPQRWKMAGPTADAANILGQKTQVEIVNAPISGVPEKLFVDRSVSTSAGFRFYSFWCSQFERGTKKFSSVLKERIHESNALANKVLVCILRVLLIFAVHPCACRSTDHARSVFQYLVDE
jgi:alpha-L-arabinofuranosidase